MLFISAGMLYALVVTSAGEVSGAYFDSLQYLQYGKNLLLHGVYGYQAGVADMNREPGYGTYLGALMLLVGYDTFWIKALQAFTLFVCAGTCAAWGGLPRRLRKPFFFLAILSPTCIGAAREIYSEALAIPLSLLFLLAVSRSLSRSSYVSAAFSGVLFAALVLTKSYFYYASFLFLLLGTLASVPRIKFFSSLGNPRLLVFLLIAIGAGGIFAQQAWNLRNRSVFGENASEARLAIALAGKVARLDRADWPRDLLPSVAGSLGTNFCDKLYGESRCALFDYRGCDVIGNQFKVQFEQSHPTKIAAEAALKREMLQLWFRRPVTQLYGSGLELLRMFFFEAVLDAGTLPWLLQVPARAWHILGSLLFWSLILISFTRHRRHWARLGANERALALLGLLLIAYHAATMAQITNVVRYVFPILPFLYYFTADGIALLIERNGAWTVRPRKNP